MHVLPAAHDLSAVGSHSEPSVLVVPQIEYVVAPAVTLLQIGVSASEPQAEVFGAWHDV